MYSEIQEEDDEEFAYIDSKAQKERIRQIIEYQKSSYLSSSSFSSSVASCSSFSSSSKSSSLLDLMKGGSTSLRRLLDMEHTSLATHFKDYSGSPITRPIPLWSSDTDTDDGIERSSFSWAAVEQFRLDDKCGTSELSERNDRYKEGKYDLSNKRTRRKKRRLARTRSFRTLPRFGIWMWKGFRFRFRLRRLRRLRIMICGKKF